MATMSENSCERMDDESSQLLPSLHISRQHEGDDNSTTVCQRQCRHVTVEPAFVAYFFTVVVNMTVDTQYVFSVFANQAGVTETTEKEEVCEINATMSNKDTTDKIQAQTADMMMYCNLALFGFAMPAAILLGGYSDRAGRKLALMLPLFGGIMRLFIMLIVMHFKLSLYYLILGSLIEGMTGGVCAFLMASFAYIADVSDLDSRALRILILELCVGVSTILGSVTSGFIIEALGFYYLYFMCFGLNCLSFFYVVFVLNETVAYEVGTKLFDIKYFKLIASIFVDPTVSFDRKAVNMSLLLLLLWFLIDMGIYSVTLLRLMNYPICLSTIALGIYNAESFMLKNIFCYTMLKLFKKRLGIYVLLLVGIVFGIGNQVGLMSAWDQYSIFLVPVLSMGSLLVTPMVRTICSSLVSGHRQGSLFALIAIQQQLGLLLGAFLWTALYQISLKVSPGFVFFCAAAMIVVIPLPIGIYLLVHSRRTAHRVVLETLISDASSDSEQHPYVSSINSG